MELVFCGTPAFAVPTLERLVQAGHDVRLVLTRPDRPRGRGMEVTPSPVKESALRAGLPVTQPERIKNNPEFRAELEALAPRAIVVVGYGRIIPAWMLELPPLGNLNLHASLLPKYRGAAPIQWAIASGEKVTGNTTMRINEGLDTGDILLQQSEPIRDDDTAMTLAPRLAAAGAELMVETLRRLESGDLQPTPQDHAQATLAPILKKEDGRVDFSRKAEQIGCRLRGFQPWPGAFTTFRGRSLNLTAARPRDIAGPAPGEVRWTGDALLLGCGGGTTLEILEVQPEGKRSMSARDFANGYRLQPGERLGE